MFRVRKRPAETLENVFEIKFTSDNIVKNSYQCIMGMLSNCPAHVVYGYWLYSTIIFSEDHYIISFIYSLKLPLLGIIKCIYHSYFIIVSG